MRRCRFECAKCKIVFFNNKLENQYLIACKTMKFIEFLDRKNKLYFLLRELLPLLLKTEGYCEDQVLEEAIMMETAKMSELWMKKAF